MIMIYEYLYEIDSVQHEYYYYYLWRMAALKELWEREREGERAGSKQLSCRKWSATIEKMRGRWKKDGWREVEMMYKCVKCQVFLFTKLAYLSESIASLPQSFDQDAVLANHWKWLKIIKSIRSSYALVNGARAYAVSNSFALSFLSTAYSSYHNHVLSLVWINILPALIAFQK